MMASLSKEDFSAVAKGLEAGSKPIIKENLVFTDYQGQLYRFSVEGNVMKDGNKNVPDVSKFGNKTLITVTSGRLLRPK